MSSEQYQRMVNSFDKEIADLEKKKATKDKEVATLQGKINTLKKSINSHTSTSTLNSKMRQIATYESDQARKGQDSAELGKKIAEKRKKRSDAYLKLQKEQQNEQRKQDKANREIQASYETRIKELQQQLSMPVVTKATPPMVADEEYDVFVSHAYEDKKSFVDEFVEALRNQGLKVWYDTDKLKWGDSMREKIDRGLAKSRYGVVILSPNYIAEQTLKHAETKQIKYDLIGKIAEGTVLTRRTASAILQGIRADKLYMFKNNPEEFITKVIRLINEQKATMIVEHISYDTIEGEYDSSIFTAEKATQSFDRAFLARKAIQDYVFTDGLADKSVERKFAEDLDAADEVCVYAKLPRTFQIPTPVGNYSPDWAIAFYEGTVKHIFFIAETKGTMESLELRPIEQAKISCAKKLFNEMSTSNVVYHDVDSYQNLLNIMNSI